MAARTQKATGVEKLGIARNFFKTGFTTIPSFAYDARALAEDEGMAMAAVNRHFAHAGITDLFVRPCPVRPRHGFVDSQKVDSGDLKRASDKVRAISKASVEADPDSEILISRHVNAECNAIITESGVTLGPGNDGATSGRNSITLPIKTNLNKFMAYRAKEFGISEHESPYFEFVDSDDYNQFSEGNPPFITQVRAGPKVEAADDYIPRSTKVGQIITVDPDQNLLEWEAETKKYSSVRNLVVYHPGGSINSHFGVHCVINQVPYITSSEPKLGSVIEKTTQAEWQDDDFKYIAELVKRYDQFNHRSLFDASRIKYTRFVLAGLHAIGDLMQSRSEYAFRAAAAALVAGARLFDTVSTGELRHVIGNVTRDTPAYTFFDKAGLRKYALNGLSNRDSLYSDAMGDHSFMVTAAQRVLGSYYNYSQPEWHSGYGGIPWAECAKSSFLFSHKLAQFVLTPTRPTLQDVLNEFNKLVNLAHNNGWWLNKVLNQEELDTCSRFPAVAFISNTAYKLLSGANDTSPRDANYYQRLVDKARENELRYRGIIESLPNYIAGAEASGSNPFAGALSPHQIATSNYADTSTAFCTPMIVHASGNATFPELKTASGRRARYSLSSNWAGLWWGLSRMFPEGFAREEICLLVHKHGSWMGISIPNHGQTWLLVAISRYPDHFRRAFDSTTNSFRWYMYSFWPFRYFPQIARGERFYNMPKLTYKPEYQDKPDAWRVGSLSWDDVQIPQAASPKGFKLLPPSLADGGPTPESLGYMAVAFRQYKMTGAYNAEEE